MNKNIGDMTESELKDFIIELQEENSRLERNYNIVIEKLNAELMLYRGSLHREHEAIHRANDFEDKNKKLEDNWNELFQWLIEQEEKAWDEVSSVFGEVSNKMKELERGVNDDY